MRVMKTPKTKLIDLLHSIAMYNDKGYFWYRHSAMQSEALRLEWQQQINHLILQIGEHNFSPELLRQLSQKEIVQDDSGCYAEQITAWFSSG